MELKQFGGNQESEQNLEEELDEDGNFIEHSPSGAMGAVLANTADKTGDS